MRKLLLLFFLSNFSFSFAQGYIPFPDSNAVWVNVHYTAVWGEWPIPEIVISAVDNVSVDGSDTTISSTVYSKIKLTNGDYRGALRDNGGQIYFVPEDSLDEYLVYDFTASEGSTLTDVYVHSIWANPYLVDYTVQYVDSILIQGAYRTVIHLNDGGEWIEGIGCTQGLFAETWDNVSEYFLELYCMSHNDSILYPDEGSGTCALDVSVSENENKKALLVFPNPTAGLVTINHELTESIDQLYLTNYLGQKNRHLYDHPCRTNAIGSVSSSDRNLPAPYF